MKNSSLFPNQYHDHTFWPWTTGMEMLARSRFDRIDECDALLSVLTSKDNQENAYAFYEWINPITYKREGAFPFRTGISAVWIESLIFSQKMVKNTFQP
jgi:hypothetical protein